MAIVCMESVSITCKWVEGHTFSICPEFGDNCLKSNEIRSSRNRFIDWIIAVNDVLGQFSSSRPNAAATIPISVTDRKGRANHTLWEGAKRLEKVRRLAIVAVSLIQHIEQEAHLAQHAGL